MIGPVLNKMPKTDILYTLTHVHIINSSDGRAVAELFQSYVIEGMRRRRAAVAAVAEATGAATDQPEVNSLSAVVTTFSCFAIGRVPRYKLMAFAPNLLFHACVSIVLVLK